MVASHPHARTALAALLVLLASCSVPVEQGEPPPEYDLATAQQASVDCTQWTDTGYVDGKPFEISLVTVDNKPVEVATANAYVVMQKAAAADGVNIVVVSGFRTYAEQQYLYNCYVNCNCNNCNLAAKPGYSNHQSGHALDLNTSSGGVLSWLNAHGSTYGFARTVPSEDWHWEWWGGGPGGGPCDDNTPPTSCTVTSSGKTGVCMDTGACAALGNHESTAGLCPGPSNVQCCTETEPEACTVTETGKAGKCLDTAACAALGNHESTPGYCPGPENIQCCTAKEAETPDAAVQDAAPPEPDAATIPDASAGPEGGWQPEAGPGKDAGLDARLDAPPIKDGGGHFVESEESSGCSLAPGRTGSSGIAALLALLSIEAFRRRRNPGKSDPGAR